MRHCLNVACALWCCSLYLDSVRPTFNVLDTCILQGRTYFLLDKGDFRLYANSITPEWLAQSLNLINAFSIPSYIIYVKGHRKPCQLKMRRHTCWSWTSSSTHSQDPLSSWHNYICIYPNWDTLIFFYHTGLTVQMNPFHNLLMCLKLLDEWQTVKTLIRRRVRGVWSGSSLFARILCRIFWIIMIKCVFLVTSFKALKHNDEHLTRIKLRQTTFVTSSLLKCTPTHFWKGVCSKSKGPSLDATTNMSYIHIQISHLTAFWIPFIWYLPLWYERVCIRCLCYRKKK